MREFKYTADERRNAVAAKRRLERDGRPATELPAEQLNAYNEQRAIWRANAKASRSGNLTYSKALPDDGIIDGVAVDIAVRGTRVVRLTMGERAIAVERMDGMELEQVEIASRLGISDDTLRTWRRKRKAEAAA